MCETDSVFCQEPVHARDLRFNSLEDDGALTLFFNIQNETRNLLLIVTFLTCNSYSLIKIKERRLRPRLELTPWLRTSGPQHLIVARDRFIEIMSECKPLIRVLGSSSSKCG